MTFTDLLTVRTPELEIGYYDCGPSGGPVAVLVHGYPYDALAFERAADLLAERGIRSIVPYVRGYGPTRFLDESTPRSGQQAAVGQDLLDLLEALDLHEVVAAGYDWGSRAVCVAAAFRPERFRGLVIVGGYPIQDIAGSIAPGPAFDEYTAWYQWYFQTDRGREGLEQNRDELCHLLWRLWSPTWADVDAAFERTRPSFANPDWVDVVLHSYRHRHRHAEGAPRFAELERFLATRPSISVPTIALDALDDGFGPDDSEPDRPLFAGGFEVRRVAGAGHNLPQETPEVFADAVASLVG